MNRIKHSVILIWMVMPLILMGCNQGANSPIPIANQYTVAVATHPENVGLIRINANPDDWGGGGWVGAESLAVDPHSEVQIEMRGMVGYSFEGWYEGTVLLSHDRILSFIAMGNRSIHARFSIVEASGSSRIHPEDLVYMGAFLTPSWITDPQSWEWGGRSMAFNRDGNPFGRGDGLKGSIFGSGNAQHNWISEISIPRPVYSVSRSISDLPIAQTLQPFADVKGSLFPWIADIPRVGMEILPPQMTPQGLQDASKLYLCWGSHLQYGHYHTHMWCETDLTNPQPQGPWRVKGMNEYNSNDYLFAIPEVWSNVNAPGMRLATGRFRDGGASGFGPTLAAVGPWNHGNPPAAGSLLDSVPLILYSNNLDGIPDPYYAMNGYAESDEWEGGAWLTTGNQSAVLFVGTKGLGDTWYGDPHGPCLECDLRGWWSTSFESWFLFYDADDLAKVALGIIQPYEPQPYAFLNVDDILFHRQGNQHKHLLGACSYDSDNHLLFVFEIGRGDGQRTLVHVWKVHH